ncbi:succinylglutamate desuccinylase/aspartoacylase family protein [Candidatus Peribacteria bacterium]|nr:succinylglutamate desuccinylase/aspartoacylase family protein [Candidatus Peribacteria bacterium]
MRANPRAIEQNIRQTEKNMNRSFHTIPQDNTYEDIRAQELLPFLRESDVLLDIHNTLNTENSIPFLISEHANMDQYLGK